MFDVDFAYYAEGFQISFLVMNTIAGFYFIMTRFVDWPSLSEASTMERQGTILLLFCMAISFINVLEIDQGNRIPGWALVMSVEFFLGALIGLMVDRYYKSWRKTNFFLGALTMLALSLFASAIYMEWQEAESSQISHMFEDRKFIND